MADFETVHDALDHTGLTGVGGGGGGTEFDYAQVTTDVTVSGTTEGSPTTVVTGAAKVYDGTTAYLFHFFAPRLNLGPGAAGRNVTIGLYEDGTHVGRLAVLNAIYVSGQSSDTAPSLFWRRTPGAGTKTYSVRAYKTNGGDTAVFETGSGGTGTGSEVPIFLRQTVAT